MRCAVDGCSPVCSLMTFSDTGSWYEASTSSNENMRSSTCMVGALASVFFMTSIFSQFDSILHGEMYDCILEAVSMACPMDRCLPVGRGRGERTGAGRGGERHTQASSGHRRAAGLVAGAAGAPAPVQQGPGSRHQHR